MKISGNNHPSINICGIGPGNPALILPEVFRLVEKSDLVVGGIRQLSIFNLTGKKILEIHDNIPEIIQQIRFTRDKLITILVSGDTGFFSLFHNLLKYFDADELLVIPGISTYQYFFAKIAMTYEDAWIGSIHGRQTDIIEKVRTNRKVFLLTDAQNSWKQIAINLSNNQCGEYTMYLGNRLSYPDEIIIKTTAHELLTQQYNFTLCVAIIINENIPHHE